jgi:hypothetical protein
MELSEVLKKVEIALAAMFELCGELPPMSDKTALTLGEATGMLMTAKILLQREMTKRPH